MSLGEKLKELRESMGLNKRELAEKIGMPYTTYNNYETDARDVGSETLRKFAQFYNVSIDYILENEIQTLAAHHEGDWTEEELDEIERFKEYIISKRGK
ncbi:helix-turn-helix domain-containing protein [Candidatus Micrarchaeota archaeon]|jgi:transcriptional regulator with XRE-family HTH domain|nr:helix-turn-helix domain-containing protein [Candidatus Micrarchaeota archaeon]